MTLYRLTENERSAIDRERYKIGMRFSLTINGHKQYFTKLAMDELYYMVGAITGKYINGQEEIPQYD